MVTFSTAFGTLTISAGGTGGGPPILGAYDLDLNYHLFTAAGTPAGTYTTQVSQNNLDGSLLQWNGLLDGNQTNGATTSFANFVDASNALFGTATPICSAGPSASTSVNQACTGPAAPFTDLTDFSMTSKVTLVAQAGQSTLSGDVLLTPAVPEPTTLLLLGSGLLGIGLLKDLARRAKRSA